MNVVNQLLRRFGTPPVKNVEAAGERVFQEVFVRREGARLTPNVDAEPVHFTNSRLPVFAFALAAVVLVLILVPFRSLVWQPEGVAEAMDAGLVLTAEGKNSELRTGDKIGDGETLRANADSSAVFKLADGSRIEMRAGSELSVERADGGVRLHLSQGTVIVNAAKQLNGHLYVYAKDVTASVVGTVFFVKTEETSSSVGVLEGVVVVSHEEMPRRLRAGEEFSTPPPSSSAVRLEEVSWSRYAEEHRALLRQSANPEPVKQETEKSAALVPAPQGTAPSRTEFDVISIRRNKSGRGGTFGDGWPGRFRSTSVPIGDLVRYAYGVQDFELAGAPGWLDTEPTTSRPNWRTLQSEARWSR